MSDIVPVYRERPATPAVPLVVNYADIPPQKSTGAAFFLTLLFGPLGMFYVSGKAGAWSLLICVVAAVFTMGISILFQIFILPFIAMSIVSSANARRRQMITMVTQ